MAYDVCMSKDFIVAAFNVVIEKRYVCSECMHIIVYEVPDDGLND
jgi:hypothetical protein